MCVRRYLLCGMVLMLLITLVGPSLSRGRRKPPGPPRPGSFPGQEAPPSPEQMRRASLLTIQKKLGATDAQWTAWEPKIIGFMKLPEQTRAMDGVRLYGALLESSQRRARGSGRQALPPTIRWNRDRTDVDKRPAALNTLLRSPDADAQQIGASLATYRESRRQAVEQLTQAEQDLRALLNARQQAQLVALGLFP